jgi:hypothetical protein
MKVVLKRDDADILYRNGSAWNEVRMSDTTLRIASSSSSSKGVDRKQIPGADRLRQRRVSGLGEMTF